MKLLSYGVFAVFVMAATLVFVVLRLDAKSPLNRTVAMLCSFSALWAFCLIFVYASPDPQVALEFYHFSYVGLLGVVPSMLVAHLILADVSVAWRRWAAVLAFGFSAFLFSQYLMGSFYYQGFRPGPWGNVGVPSSARFWSSFSPLVYFSMEVVGLVALLRARARSTSRRMKGQRTVAAAAIPITYALYFGAWYLDDALPVPPLEIFTGIWTLVVFVFLIVRYRYGRRDDELIETYLATALHDAVLLIDSRRVILAANPAAQRRFAQHTNLVGTDFVELLDDPEAFLQDWERAQTRQEVHRGQPHLMGGRSALVTLSPAYNRSGEFEGATVLVGNLGNLDETAREQQLTAREKQILVLLLQGQSHSQIAQTLTLAPGTVKSHAHNIFEKTGATNRTQLFAKVLSAPVPTSNVS